jgi:ATP-dependent helicase YprA (DUF1998 family)
VDDARELLIELSDTPLPAWPVESIRPVLDGRDKLVVMPTGSGKSLIINYPPSLPGPRWW